MQITQGILAIVAPTTASIAALVTVLVAMWRSDKRIDNLEARIDARFEKIDARFEKIDVRFDRVDSDLRRFYEFYGRHDKAIEMLEKKNP